MDKTNNQIKNSKIIFSVTDLSSYDYCKRKFYLQKKLKLKEPLKPSMIIGTIKHSTFEEFNLKEKEIILKIKKEHTEEEIKKIILEKYYNTYKKTILKYKEQLYDFNISTEEVYEDKKIFLADTILRTKIILENKKKGLIGEKLYKNMNPKIIAEQKIEEKEYSLKGIIDRIIEYKKEKNEENKTKEKNRTKNNEEIKKTITIYEFKSGKTPKTGVWSSHKTQIEAYLTLLSKQKNKNTIIKEGIINYIDTNTERKIKYNPFMKIEILKKIDELKKTITKKEIPEKTTNKNKCISCGLKKYCYNKTYLKKLLEKTV